MILNQGNIGACAGVSLLGALKVMRPEIDEQSLLQEVLADKDSRFTYQRSANWFAKKGLIKRIRPCTYSPALLRKQPILTGATNVDWGKTGSPPYMLEFEKRDTVGSHFFFIKEPGKVQNSWGQEWGDNGFFYFKQSQVKQLKQMFIIIL